MSGISSNTPAQHNPTINTPQPNNTPTPTPSAQVIPTSQAPSPSAFRRDNSPAQRDFANSLSLTPQKRQMLLSHFNAKVKNSSGSPTDRVRIDASRNFLNRYLGQEEQPPSASPSPSPLPPRSPSPSPVPDDGSFDPDRFDSEDVSDADYEFVDSDDDDLDVDGLTQAEKDELSQLMRDTPQDQQSRFPGAPSSRNNSGGDRNIGLDLPAMMAPAPETFSDTEIDDALAEFDALVDDIANLSGIGNLTPDLEAELDTFLEAFEQGQSADTARPNPAPRNNSRGDTDG
ncbi:hypothetical protein [Methylocystis echinoides]|uniref:Uncharacterized protein n=1 Tax=Methylocystis echinoides TaxID=29468 RepID=A0A9W6GWE1_9HYPH|nr:hypothetical protein [Methylocystis echinoides]GLI94171.1 hypothetical protein LMG27198_31630 [Methylocystis echinoides]